MHYNTTGHFIVISPDHFQHVILRPKLERGSFCFVYFCWKKIGLNANQFFLKTTLYARLPQENKRGPFELFACTLGKLHTDFKIDTRKTAVKVLANTVWSSRPGQVVVTRTSCLVCIRPATLKQMKLSGLTVFRPTTVVLLYCLLWKCSQAIYLEGQACEPHFIR